ncbi:MAG: SurA N-terminal domain-containing protein, partial [Alphaproteobacteria bacterium]
MLIAMRRGAAGWVAKILFGLLILSFGAWGVGDYLTPDADPVVAEVGGVEIRRTALDRAERRQLEQMRRALGGAFDPASLPEDALRSAALDQLIGQAALDMEARDLGVAVGGEAIGQAIGSNPQFASDDGRFDPAAFRRALFVAGMTEQAYVDSLRGDLIRAQLASAVAVALPPPLPVAEALYQIERQRRDVAYVEAATGAIETPAPTDEELKAFVEANQERYAEPERRDVRAVIVSPEAAFAATQATDEEVAARYEAAKDKLMRPERRTLVQALFQDEEAAKAFRSTAPTEADVFTNLAELAGADVTELGELTQADVFPKALADVVFAAQAKAATQPVKTALGWHVVLIAGITPAGVAPFEEVKDELRQDLRREKAETGLVERGHALEDALAAGGDLEAASRDAGLPITTFAGIDRQGLDAKGARMDGLPDDAGFLDAVFERSTGDQSGLIELDGGVFAALIVDKVTPTAPKPFEAVRAEAEEAWRAKTRREMAAAQIAALLDAKSLGAFEAAAADAGLNVQNTGLLGRDDMAETDALPAHFVEDIFAAPPKTAVKTDADGAVVAAFVVEASSPDF